MTRIGWWMVDSLSRLLDDNEREIVRGDLAECRTPTGKALREVLGLVLRRQAAWWFGWKPWLALATIVVPIGVLLSHASRSWGEGAAEEILLYGRLWDFSYLANPGWRADLISVAVRIAAAWLALIGWSWTSGFALARLSRPTVWLTVTMLCVVVVTATSGTNTIAHLHRHHEPSLQHHITFTVFPRLLRIFLVVLPVVWGAWRGARCRALRVVPTVIGVLLLSSVAVVASRGLESSMSFGRGVLPADKGPDGFVVSADDPRPLWFLSLVMMWPAAYILAEARPGSRSEPDGASGAARSRSR
jgi:hypothetical protein